MLKGAKQYAGWTMEIAEGERAVGSVLSGRMPAENKVSVAGAP